MSRSFTTPDCCTTAYFIMKFKVVIWYVNIKQNIAEVYLQPTQLRMLYHTSFIFFSYLLYNKLTFENRCQSISLGGPSA